MTRNHENEQIRTRETGVININDVFVVKLTQEGQRVLEEDIRKRASTISAGIPNAKAGLASHYRRTKDGSTEFQLWDLMRIYGPLMSMSGQQYFERNRIKFKQD